MLGMSWRTRAVVAIGITVAYVSLPLALDMCAASCAAATPSCHQATSSLASPHIGHAPVGCGHDHDVVLRSAAASLKTPSWPSAPAQAVLNTPALDMRARRHGWQHSAGPPLFPIPHLAIAPLRI
jgi:hypothetical protein